MSARKSPLFRPTLTMEWRRVTSAAMALPNVPFAPITTIFIFAPVVFVKFDTSRYTFLMARRTWRTSFTSFFAGVFLLSLLALQAFSQAPDFAKEELAWRAQHVTDLQKPDGWLSLIGLEWLQPGETTIGSAPDNKIHLPASAPAHLAVLKLENDVVQLVAPNGGFPSGLQVNGAPAKEQTLHAEPDHDKSNPRITSGTLNFYVIRRGDRFAVRLKDARSPSLAEFHGLKWYAPVADYKVTAKWVPYNPAKKVSLITLI